MEHLSKFSALNWRDKLLMFPVAGGIFVSRVLLNVIPYRHVLSLHGWTSGAFRRRFGTGPDPTEYTDRIVRLVKGVGRRVLGKKPCLPQALVTQWFLQRNGFDAKLRIGVTKDDSGAFLAHAWIESGGDIVIGGRLSRYRYARMGEISAA